MSQYNLTELNILDRMGFKKHIDTCTKEDAIRWGLKTYFTGTPCDNGHISERYVKGGRCLKCRSVEKENNKTEKGRRISYTLASVIRKKRGLKFHLDNVKNKGESQVYEKLPFTESEFHEHIRSQVLELGYEWESNDWGYTVTEGEGIPSLNDFYATDRNLPTTGNVAKVAKEEGVIFFEHHTACANCGSKLREVNSRRCAGCCSIRKNKKIMEDESINPHDSSSYKDNELVKPWDREEWIN